MTEEAQNRAIAKAVNYDLWVITKNGGYYRPGAAGYTTAIEQAWKLPKAEAKKYEMYADRDDVCYAEKVLLVAAPHPDYVNDLNAMHEAEETLDGSQFSHYTNILCDMVDPGDPDPNIEGLIRLTSAQRGEAFLKALNLWES